MRNSLFIFVTLFFLSNANAQVVVEDTNITFAGSGMNYTGTILQDLQGDDTSVDFAYEDSTLEAVLTVVDEGSDWYLVGAGDTFSSASIANGDHEAIFTLDTDVAVLVGDTTFYLGVNTGLGFGTDPNIFSPGRDVFGWVQLQNNQGNLEVIGSAVVYGGTGVIVGTSTAIPEPVVLGDVNQDGVTNFADIPAFVSILIAGDYQVDADIDQNNVVDFLTSRPSS